MRIHEGELTIVIRKTKKPKSSPPGRRLVFLLVCVTEWHEDREGFCEETVRLVGLYDFYTKKQAKNFIQEAIKNHYDSLPN